MVWVRVGVRFRLGVGVRVRVGVRFRVGARGTGRTYGAPRVACVVR